MVIRDLSEARECSIIGYGQCVCVYLLEVAKVYIEIE